MIARRTIALTLQAARIKVLVWRLLATRAACGAIRRAANWLAPAGRPEHHRKHRTPP
jgi:hypothetical protein